jgi:hypothetical protein
MHIKSSDSINSPGISIHVISNLEVLYTIDRVSSLLSLQYRARLDAIRGPPVSLVSKLPVSPRLAHQNSNLIRSWAKVKVIRSPS